MAAEAKQKVLMELCGPGGPFEMGPGEWKTGYDGRERVVKGTVFRRSPGTLRQLYDRTFLAFQREEFAIFNDERLTFGQFYHRAAALSACLQEKHGVKTGDRVGICMRNCPEWMEAYVAITAIGAVVVPLNSMWKGHELEYGLEDAGTKVLFADQRRLESVAFCLPRLKIKAILVRGNHLVDPSVCSKHEDEVKAFAGSKMPFSHGLPDDIIAIMYTSGTTGYPKGVVQTQRGIITQMCVVLITSVIERRLLGSKRPQVCLLPVPLFHVTANHHIFLASLVTGKKVVIMEKWDALQALRLIEREGVTAFTGVPTMAQDMIEHKDFAKFDTSSLTSISGGGAAVPGSLATKVKDRFKGGNPAQGYGLTETNGAVCWITGDEFLSRPTSTGQPLPTVDTLVVDTETGRVLSKPNERGELLLKGPLCLPKYWNKEKATNEAIVEVPGHGYGWFRTGDIVVLDEARYVHIMDRAKDIIIRGGENISCAEVESAFFSRCKEIHELSCFGLKDQRLGEVVGLLVHPKAGTNPSAGELLRVVRESGDIASFKLPPRENIFFTDKPLPRGDTGKILKRQIRDYYNKLRSQNAKL